NVDYLHQPWRAFATVINKCLRGKETAMDKIRLSRAQILWDAKKTNKMSYPRFTKIIIDYLRSKDQSISRRNKMFWHTALDDIILINNMTKKKKNMDEFIISDEETCMMMKMGEADQQNASQQSGFKKEEEDAHATLTLVLETQKIRDVATLVIEKNVTESLEAAVLTREKKSFDVADYKRELYDALIKSYNTDKDIFESYGEVFLLKRSRDERDKDQDPSPILDQGTKRRKSSKDAKSSRDLKSKEKKSSSTSKDAFESQHKSSDKSVHKEEPSHIVEDSGMHQDQEFVTRDNDQQPTDKEVTKADWFKKLERPPTPDPDWNQRRPREAPRAYLESITKKEEGLEAISR
nr:hypothetical protein [Tanacetum cinerariifolium]